MRMPILSMSAETLLGTYGLYHLTQLLADPELAELAESFRKAQEGLQARNREHRNAEAASLVAMAVRDRKDMALDQAVLRFNHRFGLQGVLDRAEEMDYTRMRSIETGRMSMKSPTNISFRGRVGGSSPRRPCHLRPSLTRMLGPWTGIGNGSTLPYRLRAEAVSRAF